MMTVPKLLFVLRELSEPFLAHDVLNPDEARSRPVGIEDDALVQIVLEVNAKVMRLDLPAHIVGIEMKPVQEVVIASIGYLAQPSRFAGATTAACRRIQLQ
jgi:hypothetical protein